MALVPWKLQTIGNDQLVTPLTPNIKTGGMWFTFTQLAGACLQMLPSSTQALILALKLRGTAPSPWQNNCKTKNWMAQKKWQNGSYCYNNTYRREYFYQKWGGRQMCQMFSRQRREIQSIAHSQPTRSGKEGVDYARGVVWVLMMHSFTSFQVAWLLCDVR